MWWMTSRCYSSNHFLYFNIVMYLRIVCNYILYTHTHTHTKHFSPTNKQKKKCHVSYLFTKKITLEIN